MFSDPNLFRGMLNAGRTHKVFDWEKGARLIKEHGIKNATAGLLEDRFWTAVTILEEGEPLEHEKFKPFLSSNWATPFLEDDCRNIIYECYVMDTPEENPNHYGAETEWGGKSLEILGKTETKKLEI